MLTPAQIENVRRSFHSLDGRGDELAERFFARLFAAQPILRAILPRDHWQRSRDLFAALSVLIDNLDKLDSIGHPLMDFGAKAQRIGVMPQQYGLARQALLDALRFVLGRDWSEDLDSDWTEALNNAASLAVLGAGRARARAA